MASRLLSDLHPKFRPLAVKFTGEALKRGIEVLIYCTYRSNKEQQDEYNKGRTTVGFNPTKLKPLGSIVTNAKPGQSKHNFVLNDKPASKAFDCVPLLNGKAQWNDKASYKILGEIADKLGMDWAGKWTGNLKETAHFQMRE